MSMLQLKVFDDELLSRSRSGTIWGRIYFEFGAGAFPERGWSDMVVVVATAWLEELLEMAAGSTQASKVHFMDGPLAVNMSRTNPGSVKLDFFHKEALTHSLTMRLDTLLRDAILAGEQLDAICRRHGWSDDTDCSNLAAAVARGVKTLPV